jgi:hypothetical protein
MPDSSAIYLFKAARRPLYRKENLHLLAADRGSVVEVGYNRMWIAPEYFEAGSITRGTPVYFVFTERPYSLFVPVRQGEVVDVSRDELMVRIRVLLRSWVRPLDENPESFTRLVKATQQGKAPGNKFVLPKQDDVVLEACYDEREDPGWRGVIDDMLEMSRRSTDDPYRSSIFFRPLGLRIAGELHSARRVPLDPGTSGALLLRFYNPHLGLEDIRSHTPRILAPEDALRVEAPNDFPLTGDLEIPFETLGGKPELTVQILPSPAEHTSLTERFVAKGSKPVADRAPVQPETAAAEEILRLYDSVRRNAHFEGAGDELDLLSDFERLLPREQRITERRGILLAQEGDSEDAYRVLRELNPETLGDDARFLLFFLLLQRDTETSPDQHVVSLDLTAEARFPRFLDELEHLEPRTLARVLPSLILDLPDEQRRELMDRHGRRLESPAAIVETASNLGLTDHPGWAYDYLAERRRTLRLSDPEITDALLQLAALGGRTDADAELANDAARRIGNLIERGKIREARSRLTQARNGLSRDQRDRLYHRIADRLSSKEEYAQAAEVMIELTYAALETGDLDGAVEAAESATAAVTRARGLSILDGDGELDPVIEDAIQRVEAAWQDCGPLVEWRQSAEEYRREKLQKALRGQRLLIAGGVRNPGWVEHLQELTSAEIDWCESFHDQTSNVDAFASRIRQGSYAVVVYYLQKTGHDLAGKLKPACEDGEVPLVYTTSAGRRGVMEAIWDAIRVP